MIKSIQLHEAKRFWGSTSKDWTNAKDLSITEDLTNPSDLIISRKDQITRYRVPKSFCTIEELPDPVAVVEDKPKKKSAA